MEEETIDERLRAIERAVADGDTPERLQDSAALGARVEDLESAVADLEDRMAEADAAVQALRGYVGEVRSVNREVERRADSALAKVDSLADGDEAGRHRDGERGRCDGRDSRHPVPQAHDEGGSASLRERLVAWL